MALLLHLQTPRPGTEGSITAHPPRIPQQEHHKSTGTVSGHGSTSSKRHGLREAALGLRQREAVPCHAPTGVFCSYLHFGREFWSWRAEQVPSRGWLGFPPSTLGRADSARGGLRTRWQCHNVTTHGPLVDSSSRNSLWEEERGATLPAPKSAHSWQKEMVSQLRDSNQELTP